MDEKTAVSKNNDCYFYYYSSCSKGDACPFRHEPAALRNETVCIFWLQGHCNKSNCIFRHMELTKQRDKIPCWFETQPGGCKKPHCPFQHQNILDHPREEDIRKKPDLILPVKKDDGPREETVAVSREDVERLIVLSRNETGTHTPPRQVHQSAAPRNPIIVPLQDGESDSESVCGSPYKRVRDTQLSAQLEWELQRLRQIQADEAGIIGYVFADDSEAEDGELVEEESPEQSPGEEEYVVEEIVEVEDTDAAHRRLHPQPRDTILSVQMKPSQNPVINNVRKTIGRPQVVDVKGRKKVQISERLGGVASRAFAETFGADVRLCRPAIQRASKKTEEESNVDGRGVVDRLGLSPGKKLSMAERLGSKKRELVTKPVCLSEEKANSIDNSPVKKLSMAERLGSRKIDPAKSTSPSEKESKTLDNAIVSRLASIRYQESEKKEPISGDRPAAKNSPSKQEKRSLNFTVKSLADIKAEKQRKVEPKVAHRRVSLKEIPLTSEAKNGTKLHGSATKKIEAPQKEEQLKVLSLAEIKAKQRQESKISIRSGHHHQKRPISPISFRKEDPGKTPASSFDKINIISRSKSTQKESTESELEDRRTSSLGARKISIKRSPSFSNSDSEPPVKSQRLEKSDRKMEPGASHMASGEANCILYGKNNNNIVSENCPGEKRTPDVQKANAVVSVPQKQSTVSGEVSSGVNRRDSLIEDEEELLLDGDMLELEDDTDEAALLL